MVSRRTFIRLGATSVAAAAVAEAQGHALGASLFANRRGAALALFDARSSEGRSFAAVLAATGMPTRGIRRDVASLWYGELKARLAEEHLPLIGLTDRAALFCLEELARDLGLKVRGRIDHRFDRSGNVSHQAAGSPALLETGRRLGRSPRFGTAVAVLLTDPSLHGGALAAQKRTGPFSDVDGNTLVSWRIA